MTTSLTQVLTLEEFLKLPSLEDSLSKMNEAFTRIAFV